MKQKDAIKTDTANYNQKEEDKPFENETPAFSASPNTKKKFFLNDILGTGIKIKKECKIYFKRENSIPIKNTYIKRKYIHFFP